MKTDLYKGTYFISSSRVLGIGIILSAFVFEIEDVCNLQWCHSVVVSFRSSMKYIQSESTHSNGEY